MPKKKPVPREEKLRRREDIAGRARSGRLSIPDGIRDIRQALGLTQAEFAEKFGFTRQQVIALENGRANPNLETLARIGNPFGFVIGFIPKPTEKTFAESGNVISPAPGA